MEKASISQVFPRLVLFSDENFRGRRFILRGNLGIRNIETRFGDIESLRFFSPNANATLVLFSRPNFQGRARVFRGSISIADLDNIIGGEDPESLVMANFRLSVAEIRQIRRTGELPSGFRTI